MKATLSKRLAYILLAIVAAAAFACLLWVANSIGAWRAASELGAVGAKIEWELGRPVYLSFSSSDYVESTSRQTRRDLASNAVSLIAKLSQLKRLDMHNTNLSDDGLKTLAVALPGLEYLNISATDITPAGCAALQDLTHLTKLAVAQNNIGDVGLAAIAHCHHLVGLDLRETGVSDAGLGSLAATKGLQLLSIGDNEKLTDAGIGKLELPSLYVLWCRYTAVQGHTMRAVPWRRSLRLLSADYTPFDDEGAKNLAGFEQLRWVGLEETQVTDAGVRELVKIKNLESLDVAKISRVTDDSVEALSALPPLTNLWLNHTGITPGGLATIQKTIVSIALPVEAYPKLFTYNSFWKEYASPHSADTTDWSQIGQVGK